MIGRRRVDIVHLNAVELFEARSTRIRLNPDQPSSL